MAGATTTEEEPPVCRGFAALALLACLKMRPIIRDLFSKVFAVARLELLLLLLALCRRVGDEAEEELELELLEIRVG